MHEVKLFKSNRKQIAVHIWKERPIKIILKLWLKESQERCCPSSFLVFERQRQIEVFELKASLVYRESSVTARITQQDWVIKIKLN